MDFLNRSATNQPQGNRAANAVGTPAVAPAAANNNDKGKRHGRDGFGLTPRWLRAAFIIMLFSLTIVALAVVWLLHVGGMRESHFVDTTKYQAVFLSNGQVYFGKVKDISEKYINLQNIYYLNSNSSSTDKNNANAQPNNFALIKLGCELHGPVDQMVINREQVTFWENLKTDGQVAKGIAQWQQQNPNGQTCKTASGSTSQSTTTNATSQQSTSSATNSKQ